MKLNILSSKHVSLLERELAATEEEKVKELLEKYNSGNMIFDFSKNELIEGPEFDGLPSLDPNDDYQSAVSIYNIFKSFSALQASDKRIWATLTHLHYYDYTSQRWQGETLDTIKSRWLFSPNERVGLVRNSIARLWWAARLTHSPWEHNEKLECFHDKDAFKYTKIFTSSSQLWFDVLERSWGSNDICRICFIEAFNRLDSSNNVQIKKTKLSKELSKLFTAKLVPQLIYAQMLKPEELVNEIIELAEFI